MKKNLFSALLLALGATVTVSCSGNKQAAAADTAVAEETVQTALSDDTADLEAAKKYTVEFFTTDANKAETATDSTYAVTSTGLKYAVVREGTGAAPAATDNVTVHYTGTLTDGTVFDSSVSRGEPATFPLNRVIPGWTEGLQLMKTGGTTVFYIPSNLAYGEMGAPGAIPPNSDLIFTVQLLGVN